LTNLVLLEGKKRGGGAMSYLITRRGGKRGAFISEGGKRAENSIT